MVLHLKALVVTLGVMISVLLWVKGVYGAPFIFAIAILATAHVAYIWFKETVTDINKTKKQGLMLGAFGIGMFLFSYAMVPLYHILCHGGGAISVSGETSHPVEVNLMYERYRSAPITVALSKNKMSLVPQKSEIVYVTLENQSTQPIELKMTIASQPRTLKPIFGLVTPDIITLGPRQKTQFPVEIKFLSEVPDDLWQTALLFLFQDIQGVGELGKAKSWEKMNGKFGQAGVR